MTDRHNKKLPIPYTRIRELNVWTISNFLSLSRVLLLPFIYLCLFQKTPAGDMWALGLLIAAAVTDMLDGWMARVRNTISSFGKIIDPVADKICMVSITVFLIVLRGFPLWLFALMLSRDLIIIISSAMFIRSYKIVFPSNIWGKLYSISVALLIAAYTLRIDGGAVKYIITMVTTLLFISSFSYSVKVVRYIITHNRHRKAGTLHPADKQAQDEANGGVVSNQTTE